MTDAETKRLADAVYGKDKEAKVLKNLKIGQANAKREFLKKYPYADVSKFSFQVMLTDEGDIDRYETYFKLTENDSFDITSDTFLNNKKWTKYLKSNKVKIEAEAKAKDKGFGIWFADGTMQTYDINHETTTNMDINKIKIYVTDDKWFLSDLSPYTITNTLSTDYKKNPFLASLLAAYVTTYVCGISTKHFEYNDHTPGIITSMARYHLYYHMSRFLRDPSKLERYMSHIIPFVRRHTPYVEIWEDSFYKTDMTLNEWYEWAKNRDPKVRNYSYDKKRGGVKYQSLSGTRNGHATKIKNLAEKVENKFPNAKLGISGLTYREDIVVNSMQVDVNEKLKKLCLDSNFTYIDNSTIDQTCLNGSKLHLNGKGSSLLAVRFIRFLRAQSSRKQHDHTGERDFQMALLKQVGEMLTKIGRKRRT